MSITDPNSRDINASDIIVIVLIVVFCGVCSMVAFIILLCMFVQKIFAIIAICLEYRNLVLRTQHEGLPVPAENGIRMLPLPVPVILREMAFYQGLMV